MSRRYVRVCAVLPVWKINLICMCFEDAALTCVGCAAREMLVTTVPDEETPSFKHFVGKPLVRNTEHTLTALRDGKSPLTASPLTMRVAAALLAGAPSGLPEGGDGVAHLRRRTHLQRGASRA